MEVLIVGGGGREHALAWKAAQSPRVSKVYVAPGNAGTAAEPRVENIDVAAEDLNGLLAFAKDRAIGLTIVGPEAPLVAGIVDQFKAAGLKCFGPSQAAAALEGSKAFTKDFLARHGIPTGEYGTFTDANEAKAYIRRVGAPIVVKADGLAAGKGVILAHSVDDALAAVDSMLNEGAFGDAGHRVVVEEFLVGEEASFIVLVDGKSIVPLASSQDHKARDNGDKGPNTGGMGAYSPAPVVSADMHDKIMQQVIIPTVKGMAADGIPYTGFLYAGLMIDTDGEPKVLEFNCRMGDPETQPIIMRLKSDLVELCEAGVDGTLAHVDTEWDDRVALGVVMASGGYPGSYEKNHVISGLPQDTESTKVFHAGTALKSGDVVNTGGRVLCVTCLGASVMTAQAGAYELTNQIHWQDAYFRTDIGYRAIAREQGD